MPRTLLILCLLSVFPLLLNAQANFIEGKIYERENRETVPYAKVYNKSIQKRTLSNETGYFRIEIGSYSDTILIDVIGFRSKWIKISEKTTFYEIVLEENTQLLGEVVVKPEDNTYLYKLLLDCGKKPSGTRKNSRVYYELKSYVNNNQIELVENFYNGTLLGYDLDALSLKTGRFALRNFNNTFFGSMESSKAIVMLKLFKKNRYFPESPFELNAKQLRASYWLSLHSKYRDEALDSIYVVDFSPKDTSGGFFKGRVWISKHSRNILKTELHCVHAKVHPFRAIFPSDTLRNLDLHITKSFEQMGGKMYFKQVDFSYNIMYSNRKNKTYQTSTRAVLHAYDPEDIFILPEFKFYESSDYVKINAIPYNSYFWENHNELKVSEQKNENELFYNDPTSTTNRTVFANGKFKKGLRESPYITWSQNRIRFREFTTDTTEVISNPLRPGIVSEKYNLGVKVFMDINFFPDTMQVITSTVFDPFESYYRLPLDAAALYFINVYFDLVEAERRELDDAIARSDRKVATIQELYLKSQYRVDALQRKYFQEAGHGTNEKSMAKWNQLVYEKLNINNLDLFAPYPVK